MGGKAGCRDRCGWGWLAGVEGWDASYSLWCTAPPDCGASFAVVVTEGWERGTQGSAGASIVTLMGTGLDLLLIDTR